MLSGSGTAALAQQGRRQATVVESKIEANSLRRRIKSVPGVRIGLEEHFDVRNLVDEGLQACVRVGKEGPAGDDEHPIRVPDGATNQAAVADCFCGIETSFVVVSPKA